MQKNLFSPVGKKEEDAISTHICFTFFLYLLHN